MLFRSPSAEKKRYCAPHHHASSSSVGLPPFGLSLYIQREVGTACTVSTRGPPSYVSCSSPLRHAVSAVALRLASFLVSSITSRWLRLCYEEEERLSYIARIASCWINDRPSSNLANSIFISCISTHIRTFLLTYTHA